jgi:hypothetical protein
LNPLIKNLSDFFKKPGDPRLFRFAEILIIFLAGFLSAGWLMNFMRDFPDPAGANGYFYLKQTESLASGLGFYFKDRSLAFALPTLLMGIINDSLLSFQLSISVTWIALVTGLGALTSNLCREVLPKQRLFLVAAVLASLISCSQIYEFALTFYKNFFSVTLVVLTLVLLTSDWRKRKPLAILAASLALLSHKSAALIFLSFLIPWFLTRASKKQKLQALAAVGVVGFGFIFFFERGAQYLIALLGAFSGPQLWWLWFNGLRWSNLEMFISILAMGTIVALVLASYEKLSKKQSLFSSGVILLSLLALQPFQLPGPSAPGYRLILLLPIFCLPLLAVTAQYARKYFGFALLFFLPFLAQPWMNSKSLDDVFSPWSFLREDVLEIKKYVNLEDHLLSHHGFEFFVDYTTGHRSRSFLSDIPEQKKFRLAFVAERWLPNRAAQEKIRAISLLEIGSEYVLVTEENWTRLIDELKIPKHWKNPDSHRPDFIYE